MTVYKSLPVDEMVKAYRSGDSLQKLASNFKIGYGTARRVLAAAGEPLRGAYRSATEPHLVKPTYVTALTWSEQPLNPWEVARLRQAVGWKPDWAETDD